MAESGLQPISAEDFERRARRHLSLEVPGDLFHSDLSRGGDHALDGGPIFPTRPRPAAVLVAIVAHRAGPTVLLTLRRQGLRHHSGQIAFPGGKIDPEDGSPCAAALREAEEEIGLDRAHVVPMGYLDPYLTGTGYIVVPVVAMLEPPFRLAINPEEVADAFEVPLPFLMDPNNHEYHQRTIEGRVRTFYAMPFEDRFIWGATAGILRSLFERLYS